MESDDQEVYHIPDDDIEMQEIPKSARMGDPDPEADIPDIQEPEPEKAEPRIWQFYTFTRILSMVLILTYLITGWIAYGLMTKHNENDRNCENLKRRFMILQIFGTLFGIAQLINIAYQLKVNRLKIYEIQEPLNYVDGRTEVLYVLLLAYIPQLSILTKYEKCRNLEICSDFPSDVNARLAFAILGFLSCHVRFNFSRELPRFGRKGVSDEFQVYQLQKSRLVKTLILFDKKIPRILKLFGLDFLCICRKIKIPVPCLLGVCYMDHCTPVWKWMYFVLECWIGRLTICPKRERGEVWCVNRMRNIRRRPGFLCINKEDPFWLGDYAMYFLILATAFAVHYVRNYICFIPKVGSKQVDVVMDIYDFVLKVIIK